MEEARGDAGLSAGERLAAASNRFYLRMRHPDAWKVQSAPAGADFDGLQGHKYCLVETFRRSGEAIPTPVWFGLDEGNVYFRTEAAVGKVKRIRANGRARVAPCTLRGRPLGPAVEGRARVLGAEDEDRAEAALAANYGLGRKIYEGAGSRMSVDMVYVEVSRTRTGEANPE